MINDFLQAFAIKAPEKEMPSVIEITLTISELKLALAPRADGSTVDGRNPPLEIAMHRNI